MAQDARTTLKRCVAQVCAAIHAPFGQFAKAVGFNEFLIDVFEESHTPQEIAVLALDQLCAGDKQQDDQIVCLSVISFLDETLGPPEVDQDRMRRLRDLAELVAQQAGSEQLESWVQTWYD